MPRIMPQAGFYVMPPIDDSNNVKITDGEMIYTTGVRGKGGHKYWRPEMSDPVIIARDKANGFDMKLANPLDLTTWATLLWSCVPKECGNIFSNGVGIGKQIYHYAATIQDAWNLFNTLPHLKNPTFMK